MIDQERWLLRRRPDDSFLHTVPWLDPVVARVLYARHIDEPSTIQAYLAAPVGLTSDPLELPDMRVALSRLRAAVSSGELVAVYGDFDADGMCATALLVNALQRSGARVQAYIPDRFDEGYGLNTAALASLRAAGVSLVVTVDCGIRSYDEVIAARDSGLDVIITDHHSVPTILPPACAVVDAKRSDSAYPYNELCGTGIAFRLAQALLDDSAEPYLDLVAVATVADIVPLCDENRALVRLGLDWLRHRARPGLAALMQVAGITPSAVTSSDIAFRLAPRLNAAGRLANAWLGYALLASQDEDEALELAQQLDALNQQRQEMLDAQHHQALALVQTANDDRCLFVAGEGLHQGLVGLIAGRLCEEHYRPAFVMTANGSYYTGSARSIAGFHVTHALETCADLLVRFGGHEAAAGFTLRAEAYNELRARIQAYANATLTEQDLIPSRRVDAIVSLDEVSVQTPRALAGLGPFGQGNPEPLLASRGLVIKEAHRMGRDNRHLRLRVASGVSSVKAVGWGLGALADRLRVGERVDLLYTPEVDTFDGNEWLQLNITSVRPAR